MTEYQASEVIEEVIKQLVQEKRSLTSRLNTLERENQPNSKTRGQRIRLIQIDATRERLVEIDNELKTQRYNLARAKNKSVEDLNQSVQYLSVTQKRKPGQLKSLEKFINLSKEMTDIPDPFKKQPRIPHSPVTVTAESAVENVTIDTVVDTKPETETSPTVATSVITAAQIQNDNMMSSTPKPIIKPSMLKLPESQQSDPKSSQTTTALTTISQARTMIPPRTLTSYMRSNLGRYEFPPNYETTEEKAIRLQQEKILSDEFNYNMMVQDQIFNQGAGAIGGQSSKHTGTIPKNQFLVKSTPAPQSTTPKTQSQPEQIPIYIDDDSVLENLQNQSIQKQQSHNLAQELEDNTWNEIKRRFAAYTATPERMERRPFRQTNPIFYEQDQNVFPQRTVQFNVPIQTKQKSPDFSQQEVKFDREMQRNINFDNQIENLNPQQVAQALQQHENIQWPQKLNLTYNIPQRNQSGPTQQNIPKNLSVNTQSNIHQAENLQPQFNNNRPSVDEPREIPFEYINPYSLGEQSLPRRSSSTFFEQPSYALYPRQVERNSAPNLAQPEVIRRPRETFLRRLRCIPKFNGDNYAQLKEFIDVTESLYISCNNESEENELFEQILLQLRGEARNVVLTLNNPDWQTIKNKLLKYFSYLANKEILSSQLENARQEENETLSAFADRVRKLLREKNATYAFMTEDQKLEYNRVARRAFSKGVTNNSLRNRLATRGATSLEDAIAYAIEAENDSLNNIPSVDLFCRKCRRNGHRLKDCKDTNSNNSEMSRLISALRSFTIQNRQIPIKNNFMHSNGIGRNFGMPSNFEYRNRNNFIQNRNWNNFNQNRNENNFIPNRNWNTNRNWNSSNSVTNRGWNGSMPNRNWNSNNSMSSSNWNTNRNWNTNGNNNSNENPMNNQSQNTNSQSQTRQNRNNFSQRQNDRSRQNNTVAVATQSNSRMSSSSENSMSEN